MLVPLLALPVDHPLWNLLLQRGLLVLAGLAALVLLARHVLAGRDWRLAGALAAAGLLATWPAAWQFEYLGDQPYGLSLALALAGLAVAEPGAGGRRTPARLAAGLLGVVAAHWVNAAAGLVLLPLALARAAVDRLEGAPEPAGRLRVDVALLAAGLLAGQVLLRLYPVLTGNPLRLTMELLPVAAWPGAWAATARGVIGSAPGWLTAVALAGAAGAAALSAPALRPLRRAALLRAAALLAAALVYALFTGALAWVRDNAFHWRYLAPSAVLVHLAAAALLAEPLARGARTARPALVAAIALVPVAAVAAWGAPSLARVRADLDAVCGPYAAEVLEARCDLVTGDYWGTWPTVFHALWIAHERGSPADVYGVAHRANPTVPAWRDRPRGGLRICRLRGAEAAAERSLRDYGLWPVRVVATRPHVDVLAPRAPGEPGGG